MAENKSKEFDKDVRFANWNSWYNDLTIEISEIRKFGYGVLFKPKDVNHYYSKIVNLFATISWALEDEVLKKEIKDRLNKIEDNIFSTKYLRDLSNPNVTDYQRKVVRSLRNTLTQICQSLSDAGLLPKVTKTEKDKRPGVVRNQR